MANPKRKMATMRRVDAVCPIEGADRIEMVRVGGWTVVDRKGVWHEGDLAVYFEPDTFCQTNDPKFAFLAERGEKVMDVRGVPTTGHVLRTIRLKGVYSQGLIMRPQDALPPTVPEYAYQKMLDNGARLDGICRVCEYVPQQNSLASGFVGKYDPYVAPRTDAERVQNVDQQTWDLVRKTDYEMSVKVDGMSVTMTRDPRSDRTRIFSHNNEFDLTEGTGKLAYDTAERQGLIGFIELHPGITLQAELCGPKIQSNRLGLGRHRLFVFSAWSMEERRYVGYFELCDMDGAEDVRESFVPILSLDEPFVNTGHALDDYETPEEFLSAVDGCKGAVTKDRLDEGWVVHVLGSGLLSPEEWGRLRATLGDTLQVKAISNRYLSKAK